MNVKLSKRIVAYIFDMMILMSILAIIGYFIPQNESVTQLNQEMITLNEQALNNDINIGNYYNSLSNIIHDLDKVNIIYSIINCFFILIYFVIIPYFKDGQTFGKYIMSIEVVRKDNGLLSINNLILRNLIINGLGYMLISLALIYLIPANIYFITISILGFSQLALVISSVIMILYRKDNCGLHDLLARTQVVENQKEVK